MLGSVFRVRGRVVGRGWGKVRVRGGVIGLELRDRFSRFRVGVRVRRLRLRLRLRQDYD